jgi:hypothetical protein
MMSRGGAKSWWGIDLPSHIAYLYKPFGNEKEWTKYTYAEIFAKKKEKQDNNIRKKRKYNRQVPCYIYVFFVDPASSFGGWYITVETRYGSWYLNWRTKNEHEGLFEKIRQRINTGVFPEFVEMWCEEFCEKYSVPVEGTHLKRGKYFAKCTINSYNNLIDVQSNAYRTNRRGRPEITNPARDFIAESILSHESQRNNKRILR